MTPEQAFLMLRLDGPLQAWGGVARDPVRPTVAYPTRSGLTGLLASALGLRYRDGEATNALQDSIRYAVREDRAPRILRDYQTADLERIGRRGWTRWGIEVRAGGTAAVGTQILEKRYLADGAFMVALTVSATAPFSLDQIEQALQFPRRPLFLGRKGCLPATPIVAGRHLAPTPYDALASWPISHRGVQNDSTSTGLRCWYDDGDGPEEGEPETIYDRRDFVTDRFAGARTVRQHRVSPPATAAAGVVT